MHEYFTDSMNAMRLRDRLQALAATLGVVRESLWQIDYDLAQLEGELQHQDEEVDE